MALFRFRWLRRMVRKHTNPIAQDSAHVWKQRLSFAYAFLAWNACGFIIYQFYKGKADWATYHGLPKEDGTAAQQYAKMLGIEKAQVVRIKGFTTEHYEIDNSTENDPVVLE